MIDFIKQQLKSGNENLDLNEFLQLASCGETNLIDRKSIMDFHDIKQNKANIMAFLAKAISAFGNYSGGILLIGVDNNGNLEKGIDNTYGNGTMKEWLERAIWSSVSPPIKEYAIKKIFQDDKYLFAVFIGESDLAPHQSNYGEGKYKFFTRVDSNSLPIDGQLVQDIFNRKKTSDIKIVLRIENTEESTTKSRLYIEALNTSKIPAEKVLTLFTISKPIINGSMGSPDGYYKQDHGQLSADLLYPDITRTLINEGIPLKEFKTLKIDLTCVAKNMQKKTFSFLIFNANGEYKITTN